MNKFHYKLIIGILIYVYTVSSQDNNLFFDSKYRIGFIADLGSQSGLSVPYSY